MATGKTNARWIRLWAGKYSLSGVTRQIGGFGQRFEETDSSAYQDGVINYTLGHPEIVMDGYQAVFSNAASGANFGSFDSLKTLDDADIPVTIGIGIKSTIIAGDPAMMFVARRAEYVLNGDGPILVSARFPHATANYYGGKVWGKMLSAFDAGGYDETTTGASVDMGAATTTGYSLHLHLYGTVSGNYALIVEHSTSGAFGGEEATLATFTTTGAATTSEISTGTSANRYLRFKATKTAGVVVVDCAAIYHPA